MNKIIFTETYKKKSAKFLKKHPELLDIYAKVIRLVEVNINHPSLRLHKLKGRLSQLSSISINMSYRITIYFLIEKNTIIPIDIGSHEEVY
jgi:mRNA-degrading endonuclease YafQ of YafQ-DinJ toxin-antitoxin module